MSHASQPINGQRLCKAHTPTHPGHVRLPAHRPSHSQLPPHLQPAPELPLPPAAPPPPPTPLPQGWVIAVVVGILLIVVPVPLYLFVRWRKRKNKEAAALQVGRARGCGGRVGVGPCPRSAASGSRRARRGSSASASEGDARRSAGLAMTAPALPAPLPARRRRRRRRRGSACSRASCAPAASRSASSPGAPPPQTSWCGWLGGRGWGPGGAAVAAVAAVAAAVMLLRCSLGAAAVAAAMLCRLLVAARCSGWACSRRTITLLLPLLPLPPSRPAPPFLTRPSARRPAPPRPAAGAQRQHRRAGRLPQQRAPAVVERLARAPVRPGGEQGGGLAIELSWWAEQAPGSAALEAPRARHELAPSARLLRGLRAQPGRLPAPLTSPSSSPLLAAPQSFSNQLYGLSRQTSVTSMGSALPVRLPRTVSRASCIPCNEDRSAAQCWFCLPCMRAHCPPPPSPACMHQWLPRRTPTLPLVASPPVPAERAQLRRRRAGAAAHAQPHRSPVHPSGRLRGGAGDCPLRPLRARRVSAPAQPPAPAPAPTGRGGRSRGAAGAARAPAGAAGGVQAGAG